MEWFAVDRKGLRNIVQKRGFAYVLTELYQNAADENVRRIDVSLQPTDGKNRYIVRVEDDSPEGFRRLTDAWTLFADSYKKNDPEKRGRFNLGEKLILAVCESATIATTTGTVLFDTSGRKVLKDKAHKRARGSLFVGTLRMTAAEYSEACAEFLTVMPKPRVMVMFNGNLLEHRMPVKTTEAILETEIGDEGGVLRRTRRKTTVEIYAPKAGEEPSVYEMGIPVVPTLDRWHYNILQKVPLNLDRDNVRPAFLAEVRALCLNAMRDAITEDDTTRTWAEEAVAHKTAEPETVRTYMDVRFGEKRVAYDPSDVEANKKAVAEGYRVVHGSNLSREAWANVRAAEAILPAGQVTPSRPDVSDKAQRMVPQEKVTPGMLAVAGFAVEVASRVLQVDVTVRFALELEGGYLATYNRGTKILTYNVGRLGYDWFASGINQRVLELTIHELAHERSGDHLSEAYYDGMCEVGAACALLALREPDLFRNPLKARLATVAGGGA